MQWCQLQQQQHRLASDFDAVVLTGLAARPLCACAALKAALKSSDMPAAGLLNARLITDHKLRSQLFLLQLLCCTTCGL